MVEVREAGDADDVDTTLLQLHMRLQGRWKMVLKPLVQQQAKRKVELKLLLLPKKLGGVQLALVLLLPLLAYGDVCQLEGVEGGYLEGQGELV